MGANIKIDAAMTVREILSRYPATRCVFDQYGLFGCGGEDGPTEPITLFARVHQADLNDLLEQLRSAAGGESVPAAAAGRPAAEPASPGAQQAVPAAPSVKDPRGVSRAFLRTSLVAVITGGGLLGVLLLALVSYYGSFELALPWPGWTTAVQIHAHIQLSGWVALFIMGIAYFALPRFLAVELRGMGTARASFALMLGGILLRSFYQPFSAERWAANWVLWGAAAEFVAALLFFRIVLQTVRSSSKRGEPYTRFLAWGSGWFVVSQAILLGHAAVSLVQGRPVLLSHAADDAYLHIHLIGFVGLFILGVTLRTLPLLLNFARQASPTWQRRVLAGWNLGVALFALAMPLSALGLGAEHLWAFAGAGLELAAGLAFLATVNPLQKARAPETEDTPPAWLWLIRSAYVWFAVALAMQAVLTSVTWATGMEPEHAYWGAFRHALAMGWISTMIFGMAYRMVPVMEGRAAAMAWTAPVVFWVVNIGNVGRVGLQSLAPTVPAVYPWMAPMGALELMAAFLFALAMWKTMSRARIAEETGAGRESRKKVTIGPDAVVADVLNADPKALEVFVQHGFTALKNPVLRATAARMVTVAQACRMHGLDLESLLRDLGAQAESPQKAKPEASELVQLVAAERGGAADNKEQVTPADSDQHHKAVEQEVWSVLGQIEDPEIPGVSIVDLGLVYEVEVQAAREIVVRMTLTTRGCPMSGQITEVVRKRVEYKTGAQCQVELVWEPAWTPERITEKGKEVLGMAKTG